MTDGFSRKMGRWWRGAPLLVGAKSGSAACLAERLSLSGRPETKKVKMRDPPPERKAAGFPQGSDLRADSLNGRSTIGSDLTSISRFLARSAGLGMTWLAKWLGMTASPKSPGCHAGRLFHRITC